MPKRATHTYESEKDGITEEQLNVCYCLCCGESVLILGPSISLTSLPTRRTDGAYVLERGTTIYKLNSVPGESKILRREKGYEKQHRINCWNCKIPIGYACEAGEKPNLTYVLPDALGAQADLYLQLYQVGSSQLLHQFPWPRTRPKNTRFLCPSCPPRHNPPTHQPPTILSAQQSN